MADAEADLPRPRLAALTLAAGLLLGFGWLAGEILRDRWWWSALLFYLPSPFVAVMLAVFGLILRQLRRRGQALLLTALALPPLAFVLLVENRWTEPPPPAPIAAEGEAVRILNWNVCRTYAGPENVARAVAERGADLVVLVEWTPETPLTALESALGRDYRFERRSNLVFASRRPFELGPRLGEPYAEAKAWVVTMQTKAGPLRVLAVDLPSHVWVVREPHLRWALQLIEQEKPDLVVGDFNSPRRSLLLDPPPKGYMHAYDRLGRGWSYTFPVPLPMLAIDQCIVHERLALLEYALETTLVSDHRLQIATLFVPAAPKETHARP